MRFRTEPAEWIGEVKSYLTGTLKVGEIKKILKGVDFEKLSYVDKSRLSKLFDPTAEISDELFKKQLDLYFTLLESKSSPMQIPIFSDYIEWVYSQDTAKIPDKMFDMMTSRLAKSKAQEIPEPVSSFMTTSFPKLAKIFGSSPNISKISVFVPTPSARISTVIGTFLVLSTRTQNTSLESVSYSSHAPRFGITVEEYNSLPTLSCPIA